MMTRSRKKPIVPTTTAVSEKEDKQLFNRRMRRVTKQQLEQGETEFEPIKNTGSYEFSKDGKRYTGKEKDTRK